MNFNFRNTGITFLLLFSIMTSECLAILADDIGGSQYATGHLSAAEKQRNAVKKVIKAQGLDPAKAEKYYGYLEKFLVESGDRPTLLRTLFQNPEERREFLKIALLVQENDRSLKPKLIMIGENRGIAVDGHHRIRTSVKVNQLVNDAYKIFPDEMRNLLSEMGRIKPGGTPVLSHHFKSTKVIARLPENAKASEVVRELLAQKMGLWENPADQALAQKYFAIEENKKVGADVLEDLGKKIGIVDDVNTKTVRFVPVGVLPDKPVRTIIGNWFDSRYLKIGFNFRDYAEFHVGDEIKKIVAGSPGKYPNIEKYLSNNVDIHLQKQYLKSVLDELDSILLSNKNFRNYLAQLSRNPGFVSQGLLSVHLGKYCSGNRSSKPECLEWISKGLIKKPAKIDVVCLRSALKILSKN